MYKVTICGITYILYNLQRLLFMMFSHLSVWTTVFEFRSFVAKATLEKCLFDSYKTVKKIRPFLKPE